MEFTLISLFSTTIIIMIVIFFLYFSIRAVKLYNDLTSNFSRILLGSCVAGIGTGLLTGFLLWCVFPTYYFIEAPRSDGYYTRYVLDENFTNHFGRTYIINLTDTNHYYCAMAYGDKSLDDVEEPIIQLTSGYIVEIPHEVDSWFKPFKNEIRTENKGEIKWHVLTEEQANKEYN